MAKVKKYYWLKLKKDFFKRHDIRIIESMENGKDYVLFYLKLLAESLSYEGRLRFSDTIPYDEKMLSVITNTNVDIVRSAMKIFKELNLVDLLDDQTIYMNELQGLIGSETEWAEKKRLYREKQKELNAPKETKEGQKKTMSDKSKSKSKSKSNIIDTNVSMSVETDSAVIKTPIINFEKIKNYWNEKSKLKEITAITEKRKGHLNARVKEHRIDAIYKVIDNVANSSFLRGENNRGWMANFDWVFKPNNFVKVLEGNYLDKEKPKEKYDFYNVGKEPAYEKGERYPSHGIVYPNEK